MPGIILNAVPTPSDPVDNTVDNAADNAADALDDLARRPARDPERPDPRTTSVVAGTRLDLLDALERLELDRPETVTPMVLRDVYELSYREIAEELGIPVGTVKSRINGARELVKPSLRPRA
jgi:RNA polymerase sigma-70 factor (ECF subfamily)